MTRRTRGATVVGLVVLVVGLLATPTGPAAAEGSSGNAYANTGGCTAYATGTGMGAYCLAGGGTAETLRERFGKQKFDRCRFSKVPPGMVKPFNATPEKGDWWVRTCINYIDWDTVTGGPGRQLNIHLAYLENGYDTSYDSSPLSEFLWNQVETSTQFPVPFLQAKPTPVPRVGVPAYMTFRWLDPADRSVVREGPYGTLDNGGPFVQLRNPNGLLMRARAERMKLDALTFDIKTVECNSVNPTYDEEAGPDPAKQASNCFINFNRSSASAKKRQRGTDRKPAAALGDVYILRVQVYWEVEYSNDEGQTWQPLRSSRGANADRGLVQVTDQPLPVREAQASNVPPRFSLS